MMYNPTNNNFLFLSIDKEGERSKIGSSVTFAAAHLLLCCFAQQAPMDFHGET
jgi:hypothetical protein